MDEIILKHLGNKASDLEKKQLANWRSESPDHEAHFKVLQTIWDAAEAPGSMIEVGPAPRATQIVAAATPSVSKRRLRRRPWFPYGIAAAAILTTVLLRFADTEGSPPIAAVFTAGTGPASTVNLPDGSVVRLAGGSRLEYRLAPDRREVVLDGKAFFAVETGDLPFTVATPGAEVTVLGTRFEVISDPDSLRIVVVEGRVALETNGSFLEVPEGFVARSSERDGLKLNEAEDVLSLLDWSGGLLVFHNTPLSQVGAELGRHYGTSVAVKTEAKDRRVTAWFENEPADVVVTALCRVVALECEVGPQEIRLGRE